MDTVKTLSPYDSLAPFKSSFRTNTTIVCFAYSFFLVLVCLLNAFVGPIAAAVVLGFGLVSPFVFPRMLLSNPNLKYVLILPLLAGVSSLWSQHPSTTIYYTAQLILTVFVGFSLASFGRPAVVLKGVFCAYLIYAIASLIFGKHVMWENNEYVFVGLSGAKNAYGAVNATVVLLGGYAIHKGIGSRNRIFAAAGALALVVGMTGLVYSRASGATVTSFFGLATYFAITAITKFKATSRVMLITLFLIFGGMFALMVSAVWDEIYGGVLAYFGKSTDLTGRVDLWYIADKIIAQNFWLGSGQFAFWVQGDPLPEAIWSQMGITSRGGFNFHNTYREVMVHLGIFGIIVYSAVIIYLLIKQLGAALFQPEQERTFFVVLILNKIATMTFESSLPFIPMSLGTIFFVTALALRPEPGSLQKRIKNETGLRR